MSQAISKTPQALTSELHIKALDNAAHFLLLEGDFDMRFWETRLNHRTLRPVECGGKPVLLETLHQLREQPLEQRVHGLVDADFDRLLGRVVPPRVVCTDEADLEATLLLLQCSQPTQLNIERVLAATVDAQRRLAFEQQKKCSVVEHVRRTVSQYGVLRLLNDQHGWSIDFGKMSILNQQWFDHTSLTLSTSVLHQVFSDKLQAQGCSVDLGQLTRLIQGCAQRGWLSAWQLVQGHDLMAVLATVMNSGLLRRSSGHQQVSEASLHRDLQLMHWQDIQACSMIRDLVAAMPPSVSCFQT